MKSLFKTIVWVIWTASLVFASAQVAQGSKIKKSTTAKSPAKNSNVKVNTQKKLSSVKSASNRSVSDYYQLAQSAYRKGRFEVAVKILRPVIKKYPNHNPSLILYADILSTLGEYRKAAAIYRRVGTRVLTVHSAFNFGLAMYATRNCALALKAFSRIPAGSKNYQDGLYYSGVCQMRAQRWEKAERLLSLAQNVSPQLRFSQRRLLDEARKRRRLEDRGGSSNMQGYNVVAPPPLVYAPPMYPAYQPSPYPQTLQGPPVPVKPVEVVAAPKAGFDFGATPRLIGMYESDDSEFHGFKVNSFQIFTYGAGANANARYNFAPSESGQGYLALNADVDFKKNTTSGTKLTNTSTADAPDQITPEQIEVAGIDGSTGAFILNPVAEFPLSSAWSMLASFEYKKFLGDLQLVPAFPAFKHGGSYNAQAGLNLAVQQVVAALKYSNISQLNDKNETVVNSHKFEASLRKSWATFDIGLDTNAQMNANVAPNSKLPLPSPASQVAASLSANKQFTDFRLGLTGSFNMLAMEEGVRLSSPDYGAEQVAKFEMNVNVPFPGDFSAGASGSYALLTGYRLVNILGTTPTEPTGGSKPAADANDIVANGGQLGAVISLTYKPFEFLSLKASYKLASTEWAAEKIGNQTKFEQEAANLNKYLNIGVTLSYSF